MSEEGGSRFEFRSRMHGERRLGTRYLACLPVYLEDIQNSSGRKRPALIRNISLSGAFILTRKPLHSEEMLDLALHLDGYPPVLIHRASAKVLRTERLDGVRAGLWLHGAGVCFEEPLEDIEERIQALAARLRASLGDLL